MSARRRGLLGAVMGGSLVPAVAMSAEKVLHNATPLADAELLAACAEFCAIEARIQATHTPGAFYIDDEDERDAHNKPLNLEQKAALNLVYALRAVTPAGHLARARTLWIWTDGDVGGDTEEGYFEDRLLSALLRDLLAVAL